MADYLEHVTTDGDRWDLLAHDYYGNAHEYERIIAANPAVAIIPILPGGITLRIPVIELTDAIANEDLPPWKR